MYREYDLFLGFLSLLIHELKHEWQLRLNRKYLRQRFYLLFGTLFIIRKLIILLKWFYFIFSSSYLKGNYQSVLVIIFMASFLLKAIIMHFLMKDSIGYPYPSDHRNYFWLSLWFHYDDAESIVYSQTL
jgi:hypothetical protein